MERKEFLSLIGMTAGGFLLSSCLGACKKESFTPSKISADFILDLSKPENAVLQNPGGFLVKDGVIVAHATSGDYIAVSAACTHQGNQLEYEASNSRFHCSSHGSNFNESGAVINGPASASLQQFNTSLDGTLLRVFS